MPLDPPRIVYLAPEARDAPPPPFRRGEAGRAWVDAAGQLETDTRIELSANSTHALLGHGVVDALNRLGPEGLLGHGEPALFPPVTLEPAMNVFYEADARTYGATYEFVAGTSEVPRVEYRIRIDNREYQVTLARLAYLANMASREGHAMWIRI